MRETRKTTRDSESEIAEIRDLTEILNYWVANTRILDAADCLGPSKTLAGIIQEKARELDQEYQMALEGKAVAA